jgi:hypothetical protein
MTKSAPTADLILHRVLFTTLACSQLTATGRLVEQTIRVCKSHTAKLLLRKQSQELPGRNTRGGR